MTAFKFKMPNKLILFVGLMVGTSVLLFSAINAYSTFESQNETKMNQPQQSTLIVTSKPNTENIEALQAYVKEVMPMLLATGGKVIKRSQVNQVYLGRQDFVFLLVMDFPSKQALIELFESPAYQALIPNRNKGFEDIQIYFADDLQ